MQKMDGRQKKSKACLSHSLHIIEDGYNCVEELLQLRMQTSIHPFSQVQS